MPVNVTVNAVSPTVTYVADGTQTEFGFSFVIFSAADLEVYFDDVLVAEGHSISINDRSVGGSNGGVVSFATPPAAGTKIALRRQIVIQRTTNFQESGELRARALNYELDYLTASLQQVEATSLRSVQVLPTESDANLTLPGKEVRAGKALTFDAEGNVTVGTLPNADGWKAQTLDEVPSGLTNVHFTTTDKSKLAGIAEGAQVNPTDLDEVPDGASRVAMTPTERSKLGGIADGAQVNPADLDEVPDGTGRLAMTPTERSKLGGIADGAQVNPADLDGVPDGADRLAMTPAERGKLDGIAEGAQVNPADLDGVSDGAGRLAMTPTERSKLGGIAEGAQVNPADLDGVPDGADRLAMTPAERGKLDGIAEGAQVNPANLDSLPDSSSRLALTPAERSKLGTIAANADANPPAATAAEIAAGTEATPRTFSPAQVKTAVASYSPVASVAGRTGAIVLSQADVSGTVATTRKLTAGAGLTGGGDLSADRTLAVALAASGGTSGTANTVARSDHTHAAASRTASGMLSATDKTKLDLIADGAQVNPANLDGVPDSADRLAMTPTERSKLGTVAANADANPPAVTAAEIAAGTENTPRTFSPAQVKTAVASYSPVASVAGRTGAIVLSQADVSGTVATTRKLTAGAGLTGGGDLSADRTLAVALAASGGTSGTANTVARSDHTHAVASRTANGLLSATDKTKLDLIADGAQVNPANLDGIPDSSSRLAMTPGERGKLDTVAEGAQVNPSDLDGVSDSSNRLAMTPVERSKLGGIAEGAQVNPASLDGVPDSAVRLALTPAERDKLAGVAANAAALAPSGAMAGTATTAARADHVHDAYISVLDLTAATEQDIQRADSNVARKWTPAQLADFTRRQKWMQKQLFCGNGVQTGLRGGIRRAKRIDVTSDVQAGANFFVQRSNGDFDCRARLWGLIQAIHADPNLGGAVLYFPPTSGDPDSNYYAFSSGPLMLRSNLIIEGREGYREETVLRNTFSGTGGWTTFFRNVLRYGYYTYGLYAQTQAAHKHCDISDVNAGQTYVDLLSAADAARFNIGSPVYIKSPQSYDDDPGGLKWIYGMHNVVVGVRGNRLNLRWPIPFDLVSDAAFTTWSAAGHPTVFNTDEVDSSYAYSGDLYAGATNSSPAINVGVRHVTLRSDTGQAIAMTMPIAGEIVDTDILAVGSGIYGNGMQSSLYEGVRVGFGMANTRDSSIPATRAFMELSGNAFGNTFRGITSFAMSDLTEPDVMQTFQECSWGNTIEDWHHCKSPYGRFTPDAAGRSILKDTGKYNTIRNSSLYLYQQSGPVIWNSNQGRATHSSSAGWQLVGRCLSDITVQYDSSAGCGQIMVTDDDIQVKGHKYEGIRIMNPVSKAPKLTVTGGMSDMVFRDLDIWTGSITVDAGADNIEFSRVRLHSGTFTNNSTGLVDVSRMSTAPEFWRYGRA